MDLIEVIQRCQNILHANTKRICGISILFITMFGLYMWMGIQNVSNRQSFNNINKYKKVFTHGPIHNRTLQEIVQNSLNNKYYPDVTNSKVFVEDKGPYIVGQYVTVAIKLFTKNGSGITRGGDVLRLWATGKTNATNIAGDVIDNGNGTYTGTLLLAWKSTFRIHCSVSYTKQATEAVLKYRNYYGTTHDIDGRFISKANRSLFEDTPCSAIPMIENYVYICNLTRINYGVLWYCGEPTNPLLTCDDWEQLNAKGYVLPKTIVKKIQYFIHRKLKNTPSINVTKGDGFMKAPNIPCHKQQRKTTWLTNGPSGYYFKKSWKSLSCSSTLNRTNTSYIQCLRGRHIFVIGDSNSRSIVAYLNKFLAIKGQRFGGRHWWKYFFGERRSDKISMSWAAHETPFYGWPYFDRHILYPPYKMIDNIPTGNNSIILIHFWIHMARVPLNVFRYHVQLYKMAIIRLFKRAPAVDVFIKSGHCMTYLPEILPFDAIYRDHLKIWHDEFETLKDKVIYLDEWHLTVGDGNINHHPPIYNVVDMVQTFLSYICG